jgi:hypothetical protein
VGGRASRGSERCRGSLPYGMGRGRGAPSSGPRTSRSRSAVKAPRRAGLVRGGQDARSRRTAFYCGFSRFSFILAMSVGTPVLLVPTPVAKDDGVAWQRPVVPAPCLGLASDCPLSWPPGSGAAENRARHGAAGDGGDDGVRRGGWLRRHAGVGRSTSERGGRPCRATWSGERSAEEREMRADVVSPRWRRPRQGARVGEGSCGVLFVLKKRTDKRC